MRLLCFLEIVMFEFVLMILCSLFSNFNRLVVEWMRHIREEWAKEENEDEIDYSDF